MADLSLLTISLEAAVPLWVHIVRDHGREAWEARLLEVCGVWSQSLAEKGDVLLFGSKQKGQAGELFNMLAEALAHMAFLPGGVKVFGNHWEAKWDE